jgi:hypothetical protein
MLKSLLFWELKIPVLRIRDVYPCSDRLDPIFYRDRILQQCGERRKIGQEGKFCKRWIFAGAGGATYSPADIPPLRSSPPSPPPRAT